MSYSEIAEAMGLSKSRISTLARKYLPAHLRKRILDIQTRLLDRGGPAKVSMMRRSNEAKAVLEAKLNV